MAPPGTRRHGRLAAVVALGYLTVVAAVLAFVLVDIGLPHADASFSGVWAFFVTMPLSLVVLRLDPQTGPGLLLAVALCGVAQAALLFLALRGRRVAG